MEVMEVPSARDFGMFTFFVFLNTELAGIIIIFNLFNVGS